MPPIAEVSLPGSKSITNRALVCAALASGVTRIEGALFADDTEAMMSALKVLGADVTTDRALASVTVQGLNGPPRPGDVAASTSVECAGHVDHVECVEIAEHMENVEIVEIDARMSGTTSRFLLPVAATSSVSVTIDGHAQLRERPFGDLVQALRQLGVTVEKPKNVARVSSSEVSDGRGFYGRSCSSESYSSDEKLPLRVCGPIKSGSVTVESRISSQFLSGLMLAAPVVPGGLRLNFGVELVSRPYVDMTASVMRAFGAQVDVHGTWIDVAGNGYRSPGVYRVEPDASAASYFWAAAAVSGGCVSVKGLSKSSVQGDVQFVSVLERMGATVTSNAAGDLMVQGGQLHGISVDLGELSDTAPTLAVVAALACSPTDVRGIGFIRGKESDRIAASVAQLRKCQVDACEHPDGFTVNPGKADPEHVNPEHVDTGQAVSGQAVSYHGERGASCDERAVSHGEPVGGLIHTYDDHRIAMAFAVLGLMVPGIEIENPSCVAKTFPDFFETLDMLRH